MSRRTTFLTLIEEVVEDHLLQPHYFTKKNERKTVSVYYYTFIHVY